MTENKMTFLEQLQAHKGGLIQLKTQLYWYVGGRGYDNTPGRICLILDATTVATAAAATTTTVAADPATDTVALLLIDGRPQRVWVAEQDVEVLNDIF